MKLSALDQKIFKDINSRRSNERGAKSAGISMDEYVERKMYLRSLDLQNEIIIKDNYISTLEGEIVKTYGDKDGGQTTEALFSHPMSPEEIEKWYKIDNIKFKLSGYWNKKQPNGQYLVSAHVSSIKPQDIAPEVFQKQFTDFLLTYVPTNPKPATFSRNLQKPSVALVLPKQDAHFNKYDIMGENDIEKRFEIIFNATHKLLLKTLAVNNLTDIIYIVGSDQFNSEYNGMTTKLTPQTNILTYEGAFMEICNHEISIINLLLDNTSNVAVKFVPGNHDQYVGWHLVTWLQTYYRNEPRVSFDTSILNRKYLKYGNSAIMLNHGDALKANDLAHKFPIEYKEEWSDCDYYYIFTGDKHHEKSIDVHGIKFYQVPQLSNATSYWDDKNGYTTTKAEMTGFVITTTNGMSDILKDTL
jgi:hypothetical protein